MELTVNCDEKEKEQVLTAGKNCPVNAIGVIDLISNEVLVKTEIEENAVKEVVAKYDDLKEFEMDKKGYFLIRVDWEKKLIEVGFCGSRNVVEVKVVGKKPLEIYQTIIKEKLISRYDHGAYLGRELQKAFIALQNGLVYVQDDELDLTKKN